MSDKQTIETAKFAVLDLTPNYNIMFSISGEQIGVLDFNGLSMTFEGNAEGSAKVFFDWIAQLFHGRLEDERAAEREECAEEAESAASDANKYDIADAIRMRSNVELRGRAL